MSCQQVPTTPAFNPYPRSVQVGEFEVAIGGGIWVAIREQRYQQELAACGSGRSSQDVATCQREARNALEEASRGGLSHAPNAAQNSVQRCDVFSGDERTVCEARVRGEGQVQGSVEGGGILRETVTPIPVK